MNYYILLQSNLCTPQIHPLINVFPGRALNNYLSDMGRGGIESILSKLPPGVIVWLILSHKP